MFSFFLSLNFSWAVRSFKAIAKVIKTKKNPTQIQKLVIGKVNLLEVYFVGKHFKKRSLKLNYWLDFLKVISAPFTLIKASFVAKQQHMQ